MTQKNPFNDNVTINIPSDAITIDNEYINKKGPLPTNQRNITTKSQVSPNQLKSPFEDNPDVAVQNSHTKHQSNEENSSSNDIIMPPKQYHIVDMYWLVNNRLYNNQPVPDNEPGIIIIGYNGTFNNIRVVFYKLTNKSFTNTSILLKNCVKITSINIFSETIQQLSYLFANTSSSFRLNIIERLWCEQPSWAPNVSWFIVNKNPDSITLHTIDNKTNIEYKYTFEGWQLDAFKNAIKTTINGMAWNMSMICT